MSVDKTYAMSAFLMFRSLLKSKVQFKEGLNTNIADGSFERAEIHNSEELYQHLKNEVQKATLDGKTALMLSGGIDSAILASFMPKGSQTYTFRCVVPGVKVIDETEPARKFAEMNGLKHEVIEVYWNDFEEYVSKLMFNKGAPIHSIEIQIYKAALIAKQAGFTKLIFGENADIIYGGMDGLLAKDWLFGEFVDRYAYVMPYKVLRDSVLILEPFMKYCKDGYLDAHAFINEFFRVEALGTYNNACDTAGIKFIGPYSTSEMKISMDYQRIRSGDTKYLVREVFKKIYGDMKMAPKIPMPRPMNEWMANWCGPVREEFIPHCTDNMTGDQKWMVWCLELFLNELEK